MGKGALRVVWIRATETYNDLVLGKTIEGGTPLKVDESRARELINKGLATIIRIEKKVCL